MLKKLTSIIEYQNTREKSWEQTVAKYGGPKRILDSPEELQIVGDLINQSVDIPGGPPGAKGGVDSAAKGAAAMSKDDTSGPKKKKDELKFTRKELLEVQQPLTKLLDESRLYFERKLDAQVQFLANQIERSTQRILHRLDGGSWMKIQDPDLRTVWKDNVRSRT